MRTIHLSRRQARLLQQNLVSNESGYDYIDLVRMDNLAKKLTALQGAYAERMAELAREEKRARRSIAKNENVEQANRTLIDITFEVEDLNESAEKETVEFVVEDGDYKLIRDKLGSVTRWNGNDDLRHIIIGMVEAVNNAEQEDTDGKVRKLREV